MKRLVFRLAAEEELANARLWYEEQRSGLGDEFLACIEAGLERVVATPDAFPKVHSEIRRVLVRRFPYGIFYIVEAERIVVLAIFHASRDPVVWKGRS